MIECTTKPEKVNSGSLRLSHLTTGYCVGYCEKACGFSVWCQPEFNPPPGLPVLSRLCSWSIASRANDERSLDASKKHHSCILAFFLRACRSTRMRQDILEGGPTMRRASSVRVRIFAGAIFALGASATTA